MTANAVQELTFEHTQEPEGPRDVPGRSRWRAVKTFVVVLALVAGAVAAGVYIVRQRMDARAYVEIGTAVLTAEALPVGLPDPGVVTDVLVGPRDHVSAGQELARVTLTATSASGQAQHQLLRAPTAGTVSAVNVAMGGVARAGEAVVTLYDQAKLTFQAKVPVKQLRELRLGMTAYIEGPGLDHRVVATVDRVVPLVGADALATPDQLTVVLVPDADAAGTVSTLVPGLPFSATVDTKTAAGRTAAVNSAR